MNTWELKRLGEVCEKITDGSHNPPKPLNFSEYMMLSSKNIFNDSINSSNPRYITKDDYVKENKRTDVQVGDVLLTIVGTIGRTAVVTNSTPPFTLQRSVAVLKTKKNILNSRFLMFFLQSSIDEITFQSRGVAQKGIYLNQLKNLKISFPPLSEQKRIVSILDEAFEKIEKAKKNAKKNVENARELFDSYLQTIFSNPKNNWIHSKLINITSKVGSGATPRGGKKSYKSEGIALVRSMNVHDRNFKEKNLAFIDEIQANNLSNVILEESDILLNITGASVTRSCVFPRKYLPARVNQHVSIIRPNRDKMNSYFLNYLLTSKPYKDKLLVIGDQGATRQAITKSQIENFDIIYPALLSEQEKIVGNLDNYSKKTIELEKTYKQKISLLEELKKSILHKAFSGEL